MCLKASWHFYCVHSSRQVQMKTQKQRTSPCSLGFCLAWLISGDLALTDNCQEPNGSTNQPTDTLNKQQSDLGGWFLLSQWAVTIGWFCHAERQIIGCPPPTILSKCVQITNENEPRGFPWGQHFAHQKNTIQFCLSDKSPRTPHGAAGIGVEAFRLRGMNS